jgi:hypothetical protein
MSVIDRLPTLPPAKAASLRRKWLAAGTNPASLLVAPCVLDVIGRKRRR